jgi:insulysin
VTPLHAVRTRHAFTILVTVVRLTIIRIFIALVNDFLTPHLYDATLAGLSYMITTSYDGFSVCVSGYNDKLGYLLEKIMRAIHDLEVQQDRFDIILEKVYSLHICQHTSYLYTEQTKDDYDNFYIDQSGVIADYFSGFSRDPTLFLPEEMRVELDFVTLPQITHHKEELLHQTFVTALVHGNVSESVRVHTHAECHLPHIWFNSRLQPTYSIK